MIPNPTVFQQGQGAVSSDSLNSMIQCAASVTQLRTVTGQATMVMLLQGTATAADGGQAFYWWSATSTAPDDGVNVIRPSGASVGAWIKFVGL